MERFLPTVLFMVFASGCATPQAAPPALTNPANPDAAEVMPSRPEPMLSDNEAAKTEGGHQHGN